MSDVTLLGARHPKKDEEEPATPSCCCLEQGGASYEGMDWAGH